MKWMFTVVVLFACEQSTTSPTPPPADSHRHDELTSLPIGANITATIESRGCFHYLRHTYRLIRDDSGATVTLVNAENNFDPSKRRLVIEPRISLDGLRELQRVFDYYRNHEQKGRCTTVEHGWMQVRVNGDVISTSSYTDSSCAWATDSTAPRGPQLGRFVKVRAP